MEGAATSSISTVSEIRELLGELTLLYTSQFDRNWLHLLLERYPVDPSVTAEIRELVESDTSLLEVDRLAARMDAVQEYVRHLRRFVLPGLREKLGVSGLRPSATVYAQDQLVLRRLIAYTFPHNLSRLAELAERLKELLRTEEVRLWASANYLRELIA